MTDLSGTSGPSVRCENEERQRNYDGHGGTRYLRCGYTLRDGKCPLGHEQEEAR